MLIGRREGEIKIFNYLRALHVKRSGFSLLELLIATVILAVVLTGLFLTLNIGQFSYPVSSAKLELQSQVRLAVDWIIKDLRQAISYDIADALNHDPRTDHLKFRLWSWNSSTNQWDFSPTDYIEYNYDPNLSKLTRTFIHGGEVMTLEFNNIIEAPFYTTYVGPGDPSNELAVSSLLVDAKLIIVITGQKQVRGTLSVPFSLKCEVKIRNE